MASHVIVGLNPTTGFPILDMMLHALIRVSVDVANAAAEAIHGGDDAHRCGAQRVSLASFPGFKAGGSVRHTLDSTHPNDAGAKVIADGWNAALRAYLSGK